VGVTVGVKVGGGVGVTVGVTVGVQVAATARSGVDVRVTVATTKVLPSGGKGLKGKNGFTAMDT
jgi:hypothetical protein